MRVPIGCDYFCDLSDCEWSEELTLSISNVFFDYGFCSWRDLCSMEKEEY